jgi:hypothetical protein
MASFISGTFCEKRVDDDEDEDNPINNVGDGDGHRQIIEGMAAARATGTT